MIVIKKNNTYIAHLSVLEAEGHIFNYLKKKSGWERILSTNSFRWIQNKTQSAVNLTKILKVSLLFYSGDATYTWRIRVGSDFANSGGTVYITFRILNHPDFNPFYYEADVSLLQSSSTFIFSDRVGAAAIAGPNYNVGDNQPLLAVGWGKSSVSFDTTFQVWYFLFTNTSLFSVVAVLAIPN